MSIKTIRQLNEKVWYRLLKVIFVFIYSLLSLFVMALLIGEGGAWYTLVGLIILIVVFQGIRKSFYYIVFGTFNPDKK